MKLSDKLKIEIARRWRRCKSFEQKKELAERYGYTLKQIARINNQTKEI